METIADEFLRELFVSVTGSAIEAQKILDQHQPTGLPLRHYIPKVGANVEFEMDTSTQGRILFAFPSGGRLAKQRHRFRFSLVATPNPPPMMRSDQLRPPLMLKEPPFFVPTSNADGVSDWDERRLADTLISELQAWSPHSPNPRVRFAFGGAEPRLNNLPDEVKELRNARSVPDLERGLVFFRLNRAVPSYLIARVANKGKKDGLFVLTPPHDGNPTKVVVYSFFDDGVHDVEYEPLHLLALSVRRWIEGAEPVLRRAPEGFRARYGVPRLNRFARALRDGYAEAAAYLRARPLEGSADEPRGWFDLAGVGAEFSYSVQFNGATKVSFDKRLAPDGKQGQEDFEFIESRAVLDVKRGEEGVEVELSLLAPEFVLHGPARERFVRLVAADEQAKRIADALTEGMGNTARETYRSHLQNRELQKGAVIFLSYKGKRPMNEFLVVWPGPASKRHRDFVFACKVKPDEVKVTKVVMRLGDAVDTALLTSPETETEDDDLSKNEYKAFHNFFHAVRMWQSRSQ